MTGAVRLLAAMTGVPPFVVAIGNSGSVWGFVSGIIGSVAPSTYLDRGGTTRNVLRLSATDNGDATYTLAFTLDGTPPDSDTVFTTLWLGGVAYTRASSSSSIPVAGQRQWAWIVGSNVVGTSGTRLFTLQ